MKICQGMIWVILLNIWYIFLQEEKFSASISSTIAVFIFFVFLIQTPIKYMLEPLYPGFLNWFLPEFLNCSSVLFSCSLVSDSLRPHEPQHARPPCPSPSPGEWSKGNDHIKGEEKGWEDLDKVPAMVLKGPFCFPMSWRALLDHTTERVVVFPERSRDGEACFHCCVLRIHVKEHCDLALTAALSDLVKAF